MKQTSLKWQISMIGLMPVMGTVILSALHIRASYNQGVDAKRTLLNSKLAFSASALVHESQKERGLSAGFLGGGIDLEELEEQKKHTDSKRVALEGDLKKAQFSDEYLNQISNTLNQYTQLRKSVVSKNLSIGQAVKSYSDIINTLLKTELDTAQQTSLVEVSNLFQSLAIIEQAKESGGKLRANMAAILALDTPIDQTQFNVLIDLKGGVDQNLKSKGLVLKESERQIIDKFFLSDEWLKVNRTFERILMGSTLGKYSQDPLVFFGTITAALNQLSGLVDLKRNSIQDDLMKIESDSKSLFYINLLGILVFTLVLVVVVIFRVKTLSIRLKDIAKDLEEGSRQVFQVSRMIAKSSNGLSEATIEQASNLQETVSSADEISAMVSKNAESARISSDVSQKCENSAKQGSHAVERMLLSIDEISRSNVEIMEQMKDSNQEISTIVKVIREIGEKTRVINDIVFQTKLLSFNASVEAARAGEHGKGFAVVAEEVGNLARMSGNAADEISSMLDDSIKKTETIVENTKSKLQVLMGTASQKVDMGKKTASECSIVLNDILVNIQSVNRMVKEISEASGEQSLGIREITKAMGQLEQVTQINSSNAQEASDQARNLNNQAIYVDNIVLKLKSLVDGTATHEDQKGGEKDSFSVGQNDPPGDDVPQWDDNRFKAA